jgi:hypothetical protein
MTTYNFTEGFCSDCEEVRILPTMTDNGRCSGCGDYARDCTCSSNCGVCGWELDFEGEFDKTGDVAAEL